MKTRTRCYAMAVIGVSVLGAMPAAAQLMSTCVEKPPVRGGELGCSIIQTKVLPHGLREPVFWHIDRFDSEAAARAAVGDASVAFDDAGTWWLLTIEADTSDHRGGKHVAGVGPLPLPPAARYSMLVQSAVFSPGMYSLPHHHSGVEAVYVIEGEACYETPAGASKLHKGETLVLATGTPMRAVITGSTRRHVLGVILYDSTQPATIQMAPGRSLLPARRPSVVRVAPNGAQGWFMHHLELRAATDVDAAVKCWLREAWAAAGPRQAAVRNDFVTDRRTSIRGWQLATTEARVCALVEFLSFTGT